MILFFTDALQKEEENKKYIVRLKTAKIDDIFQYVYYAGYRIYPDKKQNLPAGPIFLPSINDAWIFPNKEMADNIIIGDERLKGAEAISK